MSEQSHNRSAASRVSSKNHALSYRSESMHGSHHPLTSGNLREPSQPAVDMAKLRASGISRSSGLSQSVIRARPMSVTPSSATSKSRQSQRSASIVMIPSHRMPSHVSAPTQSKASSVHTTKSEASQQIATQRAPPSSFRAPTQTGRSRSQAPSASRSESNTHISLPASRVSTSRIPPSSVRTDLLPSTLAGSRGSSAGSRSKVGSSFSSYPPSFSGLPEGPAVELCDCTEPWITEENCYCLETFYHLARHVIGVTPTTEKVLRDKIGIIRHCQHRGVSPAAFGLTHWGPCHLESGGGGGDGSHMSSRYPSSYGRSRASGRGAPSVVELLPKKAESVSYSGNGRIPNWIDASRGRSGPRTPSEMSVKTAPSVAWKGGKAETVLPKESASQVV